MFVVVVGKILRNHTTIIKEIGVPVDIVDEGAGGGFVI